MARTSAITVQATLSPLQAFPTNSLVNNRAFYDVSFKTATTNQIRQVLLTFPAGTGISQAAVVEVSGIGLGTFSNSGQTVTYTVSSPTQIQQGTTIRLQVDYVANPPTPSPTGGYKIQVTTKDPSGATIDSGSTSGYQIKKIGTSDIAAGAIDPIIVNRLGNSLTILPGTGNSAQVTCGPGEIVSGGGYSVDINGGAACFQSQGSYLWVNSRERRAGEPTLSIPTLHPTALRLLQSV